MIAASYAIAAVLLFGATALATGILVGLRFAFKAMDRGTGAS